MNAAAIQAAIKAIEQSRDLVGRMRARQPNVQWSLDKFYSETHAAMQGLRALSSEPPADLSAPQEAQLSADTLYLLRRLLSNQHTLTGPEFRAELTKIVGEACRTQAPPAPAAVAVPVWGDIYHCMDDIRALLARQHKMHHSEFINELAGIVTAAPRREDDCPAAPAPVTGVQTGGA